MKNKIIAVILLIWIIAVAGMIFWFSSKTGEESGDMSQNVTNEIFDDEYPDEETERLLHHLVRKGAHIAEYGVLGISVCVFLFFITDAAFIPQASRPMLSVCAWAATTFYAVTDEIHQMFVPGRGPSVRDVMIDAVGALIGVAAVWAICRFALKNRKICIVEGGT